MSTQNIFQVQKENDLDEILSKNSDKLTVVMFSSATCGPCVNFKPIFLSVSRENPDCFFIYLDVSKFQQTEYKYLKNLKGTPKFSYYYNKYNMADVLGSDKKVFMETMFFLKNKIRERNYEIQKETINKQQEQLVQQQQQTTQNQDPQKIFNDKLEMLQKLHALTQQGIVLSQNYGIESDLHEMIQDYVKQTTPKPVSEPTSEISLTNAKPVVELSASTPISNEQLLQQKKQEQLKKIQELYQANKVLQMQQAMKLQKLQMIQKRKEQIERQEHNDSE